MKPMARARIVRFLGALAALPLVTALALKTMGEPIRPEDLWWHLGMGRVIAGVRAIPLVDLFSFTRRGVPYFDQPWLAQLVLFFTHDAVGLAGLLLLGFLLMLAAETMIVASAVRRGARIVPALLVQFALAPVAARGWSMRPQALAVPIFAAYVFLLARWRSGERAPIWLLVPLMIVWANLHGSFPFGVALVVLTLLAAAIDAAQKRRGPAVAWKELGLVAAGCALAPLVNPRGSALFGYVISLLRDPSVHIAREWQTVTLADAEGRYVAAVLLATCAIAVWKRPRLGDLVLIAPFAVLLLSAVRNGIWLSFVLGPLVASWLAPATPAEGVPRRLVAASAIAILLFSLIPWIKPLLLPRPYGPLVWSERTPIAAAEALARDPRRPARLFHGMGFGSYLIFALPSQPVFLDPRLELYPMSYWNDLATAGAGRDVGAILERYGIEGVLAEKHRQAALVTTMRALAGFELRYEDDDCAYFARP
jgi:hypothetical protein